MLQPPNWWAPVALRSRPTFQRPADIRLSLFER